MFRFRFHRVISEKAKLFLASQCGNESPCNVINNPFCSNCITLTPYYQSKVVTSDAVCVFNFLTCSYVDPAKSTLERVSNPRVCKLRHKSAMDIILRPNVADNLLP